MNELFNKVKNILNKDVSHFLNKHKVLLASFGVVVLLACISLIVTYAFYQVVDTTPIIGASTSNIPDLDIRVMAEERDTNGNGVGSYDIYPYIPQAGYKYNSTKSYCTNGSTISYNADNYDVDITASGHDVCYLYFDSIASLDITLEVYAENTDEDGVGNGEYTKLETTKLPSLGYEYNTTKSYCYYAGEESTHVTDTTVSYSADENNFTVNAAKRGAVCKVYMDAIDVDIALKIYVQAKKNSSLYYEAENFPTNAFYDLNETKSACTGTSTMSIKYQKINIAATSRTSCVAYLDVSSGPMIESMQASVDNVNVTIDLTNNNLGVNPTIYYYSSDNGATYISSLSSSYTFENLVPFESFKFAAYSVDANGKTSRIFNVDATTTYALDKPFDYSSTTQSLAITVSGYYKLQVWGAQGGSYNTSYATGGLGGYSVGLVYLNAGDTLYINTGGQGSYGTSTTYTAVSGGGSNGGGSAGYRGGAGGGGTDIRVNDSSSLYARIIVAGGGGGAYSYNATYKANGGAAGGTSGTAGSYYSSSYSKWVGGGATQSAGGTAGTGSSTNYNGKAGTFGVGANTGYKYNSTSYYSNGAGGGGWYGGGSAGNYSSSSRTRSCGGGGGSGFINTSSATKPSGYLYTSSYLIVSDSTITSKLYGGTETFTSPSGVSETGHSGNGAAYVSFYGLELK